MKELILNPLVLTLLCLVTLVYLVIGFQLFSKNHGLAKTVENFFIIASMMIISGMNIKISGRFHPANLYNPDLTLPYLLMNISFYVPFLVVLYPRLHYTIKNFFGVFFALVNRVPAFGFYLVLMILSSINSLTPIHTMKATFVFILFTLVFIYVGKEYTMKELFSLLVWYHGVNACMSLFYGTGGSAWRGVYLHKNFFGGTMALAVVLFYIQSNRVPKYQWLFLCLAALAVFLVQKSNSGMAKVILIVLISLFIFLRFIRKLPPRIAFASMSFFLAIWLSVVIIITTNAEYIIVEKLGKDMTLSGRTTIWEEIGQVNERPWFGYGYDGFWQFWRGIDNPAYSIKTDSGFVPHNSHNGFIEIWLTVGWVGLALFMYSFLTNIYNALRYLIQNQEQESALPLLIFTWILIIAITEFFIMRIGTHWMFYVLMTTQLAFAKK